MPNPVPIVKRDSARFGTGEEKSEKILQKYLEQGIMTESDINNFLSKDYTYSDIVTLIEKNK